jgi:hypothetical protein
MSSENTQSSNGGGAPNLTSEQLKALGTKDQKEVVVEYPTETDEQKLNVPYIEK